MLSISERQLRSWERQQFFSTEASFDFNDLIALRTLLKLKQNRVATARIRRVLVSLRKRLDGVGNPLTETRIVCEGGKITVQVDGSTMEAISGQLLFDFDDAGLRELKNMLSFPQKSKAAPPSEPVRNTKESEFWFQKGLELERTGAPIEEAVKAYLHAVFLDPHSTGALANLGTIHFHRRAWEDAEKCYRKALEADPHYALAHFNLGNLYDEKGDREKAIAHYQDALRLDPTYADAHYNLALLHQSMGQMKALKHWKAYLKLDSSSSWANIAREQMEKLRQSTVVEGGKNSQAYVNKPS